MDSPANMRPRPFINPPRVFVDMEIPSDIQDIPPDCVYIVSPGASNLISTAGMVVPIILYFIGSSLSGVLNDENTLVLLYPKDTQTSVYKGYKQDKIEMRGDRAEMSDFPLYLNTVAGGLDCRDQTIGGFSFVVKIYALPVVEIIG